MAPQPINRVVPNVEVDFNPTALVTVPHITALPMTTIATWATIDNVIAKMLSHLMRSGDFAIGVAMFHAIKSPDGQRQAVLAAAEMALATDDYRLIQAVWKASKASRDRRHEYAHHVWGVPNIPDALALLDPKDSLRELVSFEERMNEWRKEMRQWSNPTMVLYYHHQQAQRQISPPSESPDYSNVMCFRKADLEGDVKDAQQALLWFLDLQHALFGQSQQAKDEARQRLTTAPQIVQALQRLKSERSDLPP